MDKVKFAHYTEILNNPARIDRGGEFSFSMAKEGEDVVLHGGFTVDELKALAWLIENAPKFFGRYIKIK